MQVLPTCAECFTSVPIKMSKPYLQLLVIDFEHAKVHKGSFLYDLSALCSMMTITL